MPKLTLTKLTAVQVTVTGAPPGLTQTAADTLGNDMTDADGFDDILNGIAGYVNSEIPWVNWWTSFTDQADFADGSIVASLIGPLVSDFGMFAASGDAQAADLGVTLGGQVTAPAPPTAPPTTTAPVTTAPVHGPTAPIANPRPGPPTTVIYIDEPTPGYPGGVVITGPGGIITPDTQ